MSDDAQTVSRGTGIGPIYRQLLRGKPKSKKELAFDPILEDYFKQITFRPKLTRMCVCVRLALTYIGSGLRA